MTTTTAKSELNKSHAQLSLTVLDNFLISILCPHLDRKAKKIADPAAKELYYARKFRARNALIELRHEVEKMPK